MQAVGSTTPWMCRQLGNHDQTSTLSPVLPLLRKVHSLISGYLEFLFLIVMHDPINKFGVVDLISAMVKKINYSSSRVGCNWNPHFLLATALFSGILVSHILSPPSAD